MATYRVEWKPSAAKEIRKLPKAVILRVLVAIETLASDPNPPGVIKLRGTDHTYRLRIGEYRVVYTVEETALRIEIVRVRHRSDAYRGL